MAHAQEVAQATPEPEGPPAPDLASWKRQDYAQMAHAQEVARFDSLKCAKPDRRPVGTIWGTAVANTKKWK